MWQIRYLIIRYKEEKVKFSYKKHKFIAQKREKYHNKKQHATYEEANQLAKKGGGCYNIQQIGELTKNAN